MATVASIEKELNKLYDRDEITEKQGEQIATLLEQLVEAQQPTVKEKTNNGKKK